MDQTNRLPFKKLLPIFLGLALCAALASLDSVIVATALPTISSAFNAGSVVSWVPSAYLLTSTCFQPLYGRFSDIFGRKSALALAMSLFMLGNLISGFSKTITQLIVFRGIAGAGGGGVQSMMQIVVSDIVTLRERGKYVGTIGGVIGVGYAIGPPLGGALSQHVGWQWCVWITIPISFVATCVVVLVLPLKPVQGNIRSKLLSVDYLGALLTLAGCALFILPLIWGGVTFPWKSSVILAPLVSSMAAGFVFFSTLNYLPQFFQVALGYDSLHAGVFLVPFLVTQNIASWLAGMLVSRTGHYRHGLTLRSRRLSTWAFAVWSIACGCISTIRPGSPKAVLVVYMILAGLGSGQASVSKRDMSVVTAMRNLRATMASLHFSAADITQIIDEPALLHSPSIGLSQATAADVLYHGYTKGFSALFIMNACMAVCATLHKELGHGEEEERRLPASKEKKPGALPTETGSVAPRDLEAGNVASGGVLEMTTLSV
ncbi:major facilitator superfamily domain-containing protein [Mycena latifolia]|nr:major facilitator superfamily domain-containing protein [Mycena latifolia]